jgi:hypothetical protein
MNSKKAQSEIITTVLIILLVLAAIIIVWQVVQTTIGNTKTGIDHNKLCLGSQLTITKAVAATGTCPYTDKNGVGSCTTALKTVTRTLSDNGICPVTPTDTVNCNPVAAGTAIATPVGGQVIITRDATSGNDDTVTAKIYVDDAQYPTTSVPANLTAYSRAVFTVTDLNVTQNVKVAAVLSDDYLCTATPNFKVVTP